MIYYILSARSVLIVNLTKLQKTKSGWMPPYRKKCATEALQFNDRNHILALKDFFVIPRRRSIVGHLQCDQFIHKCSIEEILSIRLTYFLKNYNKNDISVTKKLDSLFYCAISQYAQNKSIGRIEWKKIYRRISVIAWPIVKNTRAKIAEAFSLAQSENCTILNKGYRYSYSDYSR